MDFFGAFWAILKVSFGIIFALIGRRESVAAVQVILLRIIKRSLYGPENHYDRRQ